MQNPYLPELNEILSIHFTSGDYTDFETINSILNIHYKFYDEKLVKEIRNFDSLELVKTSLDQIEQIQRQERTQEVVNTEEALIFIIERCLENFNEGRQVPDRAGFDTIYCLALECLKMVFSCNSNALFKESAQLKLNTSDNKLGLGSINTTIAKLGSWFSNRNEQNKFLKSTFPDQTRLTENCQQKLKDDIDPEFSEVFGASLSNAIKLLSRLSDPPFISSTFTVFKNSDILESAKEIDINSSKLLALLEGFSLTPENKSKNPRNPWDYKQKDRLRKKPLIKISLDGNTYFLFSSSLLVSRLYGIDEDLILRPENRLPEQWNFPNIMSAFTTAREFMGNVWFENVVEKLMSQIEIIGFKPTYPNVHKLGPLDFLGISSDSESLIIIECKLLDQEFEAKGFRNQLESFDKLETGYIPKFQKKIKWCVENLNFIKTDLKNRYPQFDTSKISVIKFCIATYYPTMIDFVEKDIPVPTIFELVTKFKSANGWPFKKGIIKLPVL